MSVLRDGRFQAAIDASTVVGRATRAALMVLTASFAGCAEPSAGPSILFGDAESPLSEVEKAAAFAAFSEDFTISPDGLRLEDAACGDLMAESEVVDLNGDGQHEIFVSWGNACTSGGDGRSLTLLLRDREGRYRRDLGFPGAGWSALDSGPDGWPDLMIGGPGFCHPVWAHRAGAYEFKCNLAEVDDGCALVGDVCP